MEAPPARFRHSRGGGQSEKMMAIAIGHFKSARRQSSRGRDEIAVGNRMWPGLLAGPHAPFDAHQNF